MNEKKGGSKAAATVASAEADLLKAKEAEHRAIAGIEAWYSEHYRRAQRSGGASISADEKAALVRSVKAAITDPKE